MYKNNFVAEMNMFSQSSLASLLSVFRLTTLAKFSSQERVMAEVFDVTGGKEFVRYATRSNQYLIIRDKYIQSLLRLSVLVSCF